MLNDGTIKLAGKVTSVAQLGDRLAKKRAHEGDHLEVRIRSDQNVPFRDFEPVMLACTRAGIWNVKIAVHRRQDVGR